MSDEEQEHSLIVRPQQGLTVQASALAARGLAAMKARPSLPKRQPTQAEFWHDPKADPALPSRGMRALMSLQPIVPISYPKPVPRTRWLRFPEDHSVGEVNVFVGAGPDGRYRGAIDAQGTIEAPRGQACLFVDRGVADFSFLATCDPQTALSRLGLMGTQIADAGLRHIEPLTGLEVLYLESTQITGAGLRHLEPLTGLTVLDLRSTQVTDAGMSHLQRLTALSSLDLQGTQITDAGMSHLQRLTALRWLNLYYTSITDAGMSHLAHLTALSSLDLTGTQITDVGLRHLEQLTELHELFLTETKITDAGLRRLEHLTALRWLNVYNTNISESGMAQLRQILPRCRIGQWV